MPKRHPLFVWLFLSLVIFCQAPCLSSAIAFAKVRNGNYVVARLFVRNFNARKIAAVVLARVVFAFAYVAFHSTIFFAHKSHLLPLVWLKNRGLFLKNTKNGRRTVRFNFYIFTKR